MQNDIYTIHYSKQFAARSCYNRIIAISTQQFVAWVTNQQPFQIYHHMMEFQPYISKQLRPFQVCHHTMECPSWGASDNVVTRDIQNVVPNPCDTHYIVQPIRYSYAKFTLHLHYYTTCLPFKLCAAAAKKLDLA